MLLPDEQLDDLQINGLFLIQKKEGFRFGVDAVLLSDFAKDVRSKRTLDLCTGTGIVPILLSAKTNTKEIYGIEIQKHVAEMAQRSVIYNGLEDRIKICCGDLKNADKIYEKHSFDKITCNPPYMKSNSAMKNMSDEISVSRHEILCTLGDVIQKASELLTYKGRFFMVHRPSRLSDIIFCMRKYNIEPKRMRFVSPFPGKAPNLMLIEGMYHGGAELKVMDTLYVFDNQGNYSEEIDKIYGRR